MELTIDQALQKAIEAHKAGQVQEADRLYTAILKAQPRHPDANHNMGVLAVGVGKVQEALPFFKTALETNPNTAQYWLSYIDALIKLEKMADAKAVFDQAKSNGAKGDGFNKLEKQLLQTVHTESITPQNGVFDAAIELRESGKFSQAIDLLKDEITKFPQDPNLLALLSHCYILDKDIKGAIIQLDKAKSLDPNNALIRWNEVRLLLKNKNVTEALDVARRTNKEFPDDVEGMGVLGSCLKASNDLDQSLTYLNKAIELNPNYTEALINRGLIRLAKKDEPTALIDLEAAHILKPHIKQIWELVISLKMKFKKFSETISLLIPMIEIDPSNEKLFANIALCYQRLGNNEEAIEAYTKALAIKRDYAEVYLNMGSALQDQGELAEAIEAYNEALSIKPDYAEAYNNMGSALQDQGKLAEAIEAYNKALSIKPDYAEAHSNMGIVLKDVKFTKPRSDLQGVIKSILDHKTYVRPSDISSATISLLKFEPDIKNLFYEHAQGRLSQSFQETVLALSDIPLLLKLMSVCPLTDSGLEAVFTTIRSSLLASILETAGNSDLISFQSALALQCFINEYIYIQNDADTEALQGLELLVEKILFDGEQPSPQSLLCLASYKALHEYEWCDLLNVTSEIEEVFTRQVIEPNQEVFLKSDIPALEEITDKVSFKVREQYEKSPYPRWMTLGLPLVPNPISKVVEDIKLALFDRNINEVETPKILIAGCGTGQHSIETAARFKGSKVLAIDLSLSSLAYAKRKTDELGIQNIDYMQADILDLGKLNKQFDVVESSGVLHHMAYPMAGWRVLAGCLKQGGLMKIGLYSELARQHIVKMREEIAQSGIGSSNVEMKSFRNAIVKSNKEHHRNIRSSSDFYSMSELRDLLFHVQEHRFTIPLLKDCLDELGLKFCGFEAKHIAKKFMLENTGQDDPYDLDDWHIYEEANPDTFGGMYQFWCQKID